MGREEVRYCGRKPAGIRSQEKKRKWHVIPEQYAAFADAKAPSFF
jgi:hypothetical protein